MRVLNEEIKWDDLEDILLKYGFDLNQYNVKYCSNGTFITLCNGHLLFYVLYALLPGTITTLRK